MADKIAPTPENIAKGVARKLFEGRTGHGGAPISYRTFDQASLANAIEGAIELYRSTALVGLHVDCDRAAQALRFLADNERPAGGEQLFNSAHLLQLADNLSRRS